LMRFLHTADWHLGRLFHGVRLTDDQRHVLEQVVEVARDGRPDVVLVAGDVYDRAVPPPEAVELLDEVLSRLVLDLKLPVVMIAGNHDSPGRLHFGSRLLAGRRLYVTGNLQKTCAPLTLTDGHGPVHFYAVPYAEPATVRACLAGDDDACEQLADHDAAMRAVLDRIRAGHTAGERAVLIAHAFVAGGAECESERPLSVGGAGTVATACFDGFHYVALGHLHRPQTMDGGRLRYSGSLLKYSFDEAAGDKCVHMIEMDGEGGCQCETIALKPRRDVRRVEGTLAALLEGSAICDGKEDYLEVMLLDPGPVLDAMGQLRAVYPNVMNLRRPETFGANAGADGRPTTAAIRGLDATALFKSFYRHVCAAELSQEHELAYAGVVEEMHRREREA
jgi:DNA repair protein SbcD/Mre11